ncbi:MAG: hypothetical protein AAGF12_31265 [Myxococcota bacterium]
MPTAEHQVRAPTAAATVLLLRPQNSGFELFMVRRHQKSGFMGGAYVFPGGKVDEADCHDEMFARVRGQTVDSAAAALGEARGEESRRRCLGLFVAAARETFEEAGILLADVRPGTDLEALRRRLLDGGDFASLLQEADAYLRLDRLVAWTRWITPAIEKRRFDARFFVASAPPGQEGAHDHKETVEHRWIEPERALAEGAAGTIMLPPPTLKSLEVLRSFVSADDAIHSIGPAPVPTLEPVPIPRDQTPDGAILGLALPGNVHHPVATPVLPGPTCMLLEEGRWRSE